MEIPVRKCKFSNKDLGGFLEFLETLPLSRETIKKYYYIARMFLGKTISQRTINLFLKQHPRPQHRAAVKLLLKHLKMDHEIYIPKTRTPEKNKQEPPTLEQIRDLTLEAIRKAAQKKDWDTVWVLTLMLRTGARVSEILSITPENIDTQKERLYYKGKGGTPQEKIIKGLARDLWRYAVEQKGVLSRERIFYTDVPTVHAAYVRLRRTLYKLLGKKAGTLLKTHNYRRAAINAILDKTGGNILLAKELAGHKSLLSTQHYVSEWQSRKAREQAFEILWGEKK